MHEQRNVFARLDDEWRAMGSGAPARQAAARWIEQSDLFCGLATPAAVVGRCHQRSDPARSRALLSFLLLVGDDDAWARRTVLQALLPALAGVAERARELVKGTVRPWVSFDDLDQHVVSLACERIAELSGTAEPWVARVVQDGVWQRLRNHARVERRRAEREGPLDEMERGEEDDSTAAEELVALLQDAVQRRVITPDVACVVYSFRIAGRSPDDMASTMGRSARTLWRWLERGERVLGGDNAACAGPRQALLQVAGA